MNIVTGLSHEVNLEIFKIGEKISNHEKATGRRRVSGMPDPNHPPSPLRVGMIDYINGLVPDFDFCPEGVEKVYGVPSVLNTMLSKGELDFSPVSSMEYLLRPQDYRVIPGLCIASLGRTHTVGVFSQFSPQGWGGKRFYITGASLTSVYLFKVLCETYLKLDVETETRGLESLSSDDFTDLEANYDGILLIGDDVRRADSVLKSSYHDLGTLWAQFTGLPFVYALWLIRKDACLHHQDRVMDLIEKLKASIDSGLANLDLLYQGSEVSWDQQEFLRYFQDHMTYHFSNRELQGFERFQKDLVSIGVLSNPIAMDYFFS